LLNNKLTVAFLSFTLLLSGQTMSTGPQKRLPDRSMGQLLLRLENYVQKSMDKTGVPGAAVAVVYQDQVVYLKGFGVRKDGSRAPVDENTVFQLASLSKPIASTVVASLVGTHAVQWDDRIADLDPEFALSSRTVTEQLTIRDLLSHRSGLPTLSGDILEDLSFTRPTVLHQMRLLPLPGTFRTTYKYSNFGYTEGCIAAAKAAERKWEDLAEERLFKPLEMKSTSYRYSDYKSAKNKATIHVLIDGKAVTRYQRDPDAEAPAGAASSTAKDLAQWLRLQLAEGMWNGEQVVDPAALRETHTPQIVTGIDHNTGGNSYYGLGWNVNFTSDKKRILSHSGAFFLGAATAVRLLPSDQLGIVVITNALPTGLAEAVTSTFFDWFQYGEARQDWLTLYNGLFREMIESGNNDSTDYSKLSPPTSPSPSAPLSALAGKYHNDYYGEIEFTKVGETLWMRLPANGALFTLAHWDQDKFTYRFEAESGIGTRGVVFSPGGAPHVLIENLALEGDGVFLRER
jgi:CubicO group peptidase (beta-lactamase class C family)